MRTRVERGGDRVGVRLCTLVRRQASAVRQFAFALASMMLVTGSAASITTNRVGIAAENPLMPDSGVATNFMDVTLPVVFQGAISAEEMTNMFTFSVNDASIGSVRVSIDPLEGSTRLGSDFQMLIEEVEGGTSVFNLGTDRTSVEDAKGPIEVETGVVYRVTLISSSKEDYTYAVGLDLTVVPVVFDPNGGTIGKSDLKTLNATVGYPYGYLPEPTLTNRVFAGWFTDKTVGKRVEEADLVSLAITNLYARWSDPDVLCTVVFDANGGKGTMANQVFSLGEDQQPLHTNLFTRTDFNFIGWAKSTSGAVAYSNCQIVAANELSAKTNATITLYAKWGYVGEIGKYKDSSGVEWSYSMLTNSSQAIIRNVVGDSDSAAISTKVSGAVIVPEKVSDSNGDHTVTAIGSRAFERCTRITSITIPATVTEIGEAAFLNCAALKTVTFKADNVLEALPDKCFFGCSALKSIDIPYSVRSIGDFAFAGCEELSPGITIPEYVDSMGSSVFTNCTSLRIVRYLGDQPDSVSGDVYAGTASNSFVSGVLSNRANSWKVGDKLPDGWKGRPIYWWEPSSPPVFRKVVFDPNGGDGGATHYIIKGHSIVKLPTDPSAPSIRQADGTDGEFEFLGWFTQKDGGVAVTASTVVANAMTVYAHWKWKGDDQSEATAAEYTSRLFPVQDVQDFIPIDTTAGSVYEGVIVRTDDLSETDDGRLAPSVPLAGVIHVKVGKGVAQWGMTNSAVTATVTRDGLTQTFAGTMQNGWTVTLSSADDPDDTMTLAFGRDGLSGEWGEYSIQGSRNTFGKSSEAEAIKMSCYYKRTWKITLNNKSGNKKGELTLVVDKSGKVAISGTWGVKSPQPFSGTAWLVSSENGAYVPVLVDLPKGQGVLSLLVWLSEEKYKAFEMGGTYTSAKGKSTALADSNGGSKPLISGWTAQDDVSLTVGVKASGTIALKSESVRSQYSFSASSLPPGVTLDSSGNLGGVPTKSGTFSAKVTATKGKTSQSVLLEFTVASLPAKARGSFFGSLKPSAAEMPGIVAMSVTSAGKISGTVILAGKTWTFSKNGYSKRTSGDQFTTGKMKASCGSMKCYISLTVSKTKCQGKWIAEDKTATLGAVKLWRKVWKDKGMADVLDPYMGEYGPASAVGLKKLSVQVKASGNVTYKGTLVKEGKKNKTFDGSTFLLYGGEPEMTVGMILYGWISKSQNAYLELELEQDEFGGAVAGCTYLWVNGKPRNLDSFEVEDE